VLAWRDTGLTYFDFPFPSAEKSVAAMSKKLSGVLDGEALRDNPSGAPHVADWLVRYFAGKLTAGDLKPFDRRRKSFLNYALDPPGTDFQRRVWFENAAVPFGATASYGDLAKRVGTSPRAVGGAMGANHLPIIVPCHRVIGSDGSLTGFGGGLDVKARLLKLEADILRANSVAR